MNRSVNEEVMWLAHEIRKVADAAPIKIFCAVQAQAEAASFFWPYKLFPVSGRNAMGARSNPKLCDQWILDSDIFDANATNEQILQAEENHRPDWVVPKDYLGDVDRTVESVRGFCDAYKSREGGRAELLIPLQPPYVKCYEKLRRFGDYFAVGSVRDRNLNVDWLKTRRGIIDMLKTDPQKIIDLVYEERIVSCDSRSWLIEAINGKYRHFDGVTVVPTPRGKMSGFAVGQRAVASLIDQAVALANPEKNGLGKTAWWKLA